MQKLQYYIEADYKITLWHILKQAIKSKSRQQTYLCEGDAL